MCLLCIEVAKGKMTALEIARAYRESDVVSEHLGDFLVEMGEAYDYEMITEVGKELSKLFSEEEYR